MHIIIISGYSRGYNVSRYILTVSLDNKTNQTNATLLLKTRKYFKFEVQIKLGM